MILWGYFGGTLGTLGILWGYFGDAFDTCGVSFYTSGEGALGGALGMLWRCVECQGYVGRTLGARWGYVSAPHHHGEGHQ